MNSNNLVKKVLVLVFLLIILIAVFVLQDNNFGGDYFAWLKMKLIGIGPELNLAEEDSGLDLTDINIGEGRNLASIKEIKEIEEPILVEKEPVIEVIPETSGPSIEEVLLEIEQEINEIAKQVERISNEIEILLETTI